MLHGSIAWTGPCSMEHGVGYILQSAYTTCCYRNSYTRHSTAGRGPVPRAPKAKLASVDHSPYRIRRVHTAVAIQRTAVQLYYNYQPKTCACVARARIREYRIVSIVTLSSRPRARRVSTHRSRSRSRCAVVVTGHRAPRTAHMRTRWRRCHLGAGCSMYTARARATDT